MREFGYQRAGDVTQAVAMLSRAPEGAFLSGGTNLVDLMKLGVQTPDVLIDINDLGCDRIEELPDGGVRIGSGVSNSDVAADHRIRHRYPVLAQALLSGASGQLRNFASTGGNLLQRTRCVYFQDISTPCNKREPGTGCSALDGYQREMAILGWSQRCVATHPSDMAVALAALGAVVHMEGPQGHRALPITELYRLPGDEPERDTVLRHGELITAIDLPPLEFATRSHYRKVRDRASYAFALVSVAAAVDIAGDFRGAGAGGAGARGDEAGTVRDVRIALGGVAHAPWRCATAEAALRGAPATQESFRAAADAELAEARPLPGNEFKLPLARNTLVSTLLDLAGAGEH